MKLTIRSIITAEKLLKKPFSDFNLAVLATFGSLKAKGLR
jgi:hypothetical protein